MTKARSAAIVAAIAGLAAMANAGPGHAAGLPPTSALAPQPAATASLAAASPAPASIAPAAEARADLARPEAARIAERSAKESPFHAYLLSAGRYVLDVGSLAQQPKASRPASAVPLPGALWLFVSALLAFLGISGRRKY